jgi:MFS family permease
VDPPGASEPNVQAPEPRKDAGAAFQYPDFRFFQAGRFLATLGFQMQGVAVGWQVYTLTREPIHLGYVGLAQFLPAIGFALITGHAADRFERRRVLVVCHAVLVACAAALLLLARATSPSVWSIYVVLVVVGSARAFMGPASQALLPNVVPPQHFSNAVAWSSSIWHVATIAGPALGGFLYGAFDGAAPVYASAAVLELVAVACLLLVKTRAGASSKKSTSWNELVAGIRYVWQNQLILGAITLDMFAVLLGGAVALLPIYAHDILHTGPLGLGMLRSAPAVGATLMAVLLAVRPLTRRAGPTLLACVAAFGAATIVFGTSTRFEIALLALLTLGATDMVSVFVRHTVVQLTTPDDMRGRVSAVNLVFIGASNELGEFESGLTAAWFGTVPAVVLGGVGTCVVVLLCAWRFPALRRVDRLDAASLNALRDQPASSR